MTSFDKANVVDQYGDGLDSLAGVPAIVANKAVIDGVARAVPEPASLVLLGFGVAGWRSGSTDADVTGRIAIRDSCSEFDS